MEVVSFLQRTHRHWGVVCPEPKTRIKRLSECGVEGAEVDQWVRGDTVEGQSASRTVRIHCYFTRGGGEDLSFFIVTDSVSLMRAEKTPWLIVPSKSAVVTESFPSDSSVSHCYTSLSSPLDLPVTVTTQHLRPGVKSLWMIRIWLLYCHICHLLVVVRQFEVFVHCVCVKCEFTEIWKCTTQQQVITHIWRIYSLSLYLILICIKVLMMTHCCERRFNQ